MTRALRLLALLGAAALAACAPATPGRPPVAPQGAVAARALPLPQALSQALPPMRSFGATARRPPARPNAEMAEDFLDLVFQLESGRTVPVLTRFETPVSLRVTGPAPQSLHRDLRALLARLRAEAGIEIRLTGAEAADITIEAVPQGQMQRAVPGAACFVVPRVTGWADFLSARRSPRIDWTTLVTRERAAIFLPSDAAPQEIRDCLHEEMAQALGPLNDLYSLPDSVFNDDNIHTVLTPFDMLILRVHYDPALSSGLTRGEVAARLPAILARLNPAGGAAAPPGPGPRREAIPRDWIEAVQVALSPGVPSARRNRSARRALEIARSRGWSGPQAGFGLYAYGRLQVSQDPGTALGAFREAAARYGASPLTRIHSAHVAVQLAAFALSAGDAEAVLAVTAAAIPVAAEHENASLLATLRMFEAEALDLAGRPAEAAAARLDSLGWARYGFGKDADVRARLQDIAALNPARQR